MVQLVSYVYNGPAAPDCFSWNFWREIQFCSSEADVAIAAGAHVLLTSVIHASLLEVC